MYRALYRKYRPTTFADVTGQSAITDALNRQIETGRIGHAYLFTGTRGTGKTTCAKVFAKTVNCEHLQGSIPCGTCDCCVGIEDGSNLDVVEIDAASNNGVDDVRELREGTAYRPSRCKYKVYIIDEVHMLSTAAFNALLKILEEPPSHIIFILATTEIHKVPATILSRCQRFDFTRISTAQIADRLRYVAGEEGIQLTDDAAERIAALGDGSMRDALSLLDTCAGLGEEIDDALVRKMAGVSDKGYLPALCDVAQRGELHTILGMVAELRAKSIDVKRLAEELVGYYRNILLALAKPDGSLLENLPSDEKTLVLQQAGAVGEETAIRAIRRLADAMDRMGRSPDPRVELELALFDIAAPAQPAVAAAKAAPVAMAAERPTPPPAMVERPVTAAPIPPPEPVQAPPPPEEAAPAAPVAASISEQAPAPEAEPPAPVAEPTPPPQTGEPAEVSQPQPPPQEAEPALETPQMEPFGQWEQVIALAQGREAMLYGFLKDTKAYSDGKRIYIDGGPVFLEFMKENKSVNATIKGYIQEVSGSRFGIGPYKKAQTNSKAAAQQDITQDTIASWEAKGVPIQYEGKLTD